MTGSLVALSLTLFLAMVGFGLTLPVLPAFVERLALEGPATQTRIALHVGGLTSAYALTQLALAPLWGWWSDQCGRRPLVVMGLSGVALSHIAFGLGSSLPLLYGARLAGGAFAGALVVASTATLADLLPEGRRGRAIAWQGTAVSLGFVAGPALGGLLAREDWHLPLPRGHLIFDGFSVPFFAAGAMTLAALPVVMAFLPRSAGTARGRQAPQSRVRVPELARTLSGVLGLVFAGQAALTLFEAVFALYAGQVLGFGLRDIGLAFALCGLVMAVFQGGAVGWLAGRVPARVQVLSGFGMLGAGLLILPVLARPGPVFAAVSLLAVGVAFVTPNLLALAADRSGARVGTGLGMVNASGGLGQIAGPLLGSILFTVEARMPFLVAGSVTGAIAMGMVGFAVAEGPTT